MNQKTLCRTNINYRKHSSLDWRKPLKKSRRQEITTLSDLTRPRKGPSQWKDAVQVKPVELKKRVSRFKDPPQSNVVEQKKDALQMVVTIDGEQLNLRKGSS